MTIALAFLLRVGAPRSVYAAEFTVTKFTDSSDGSCDVDCSLREAIIAANENGQADTIALGAGIYVLTATTGAGGPESGDLDITGADALTIAGAGPGLTVIDANGIDRVFDIHPGTSAVVISGVTVVGGNVAWDGGGILIEGRESRLIASEVLSNTAGGDGGGIFVGGGGGALRLADDSLIAQNSADHAGGGVCVGLGGATLEGQIADNTAGDGGGVCVYFGTATLSGGAIVGNNAGRGGGVFVSESGGAFTQTGSSVIARNVATNGGGLFLDFGQAVLGAGRISDNTADQNGGGVYVSRSGAGFIQSGDSIVRHNSAGYGGGLFIGAGQATVAGGRILGNEASVDGGGVFVSQSDARFTQSGGGFIGDNVASHGGGGVCVGLGRAMLTGGQIRRNSAGDGGGVYVYSGTATFSGGWVGRNHAGRGGGVFVGEGGGAFTQTQAAVIALNTATNGGGLFLDAGRAALSGGRIVRNVADQQGGGVYVNLKDAVYAQSGGGDVASNSAHDGGGVFINLGQAIVTAGEIRSNSAISDGGGVFVNQDGAALTQSGDTVIADNTAGQAGGALLIGLGRASLTGCQMRGNSAGYGGGVCVYTGTATLSRGLVISNTASGGGGGLYNHTGGLTVTNTTISHNRAMTGGGLYNGGGISALDFATVASNTASAEGDGIQRTGGTVWLRNTLVAHNGAANCHGGLTSDGYNLENTDTCGLGATGDRPNTDPMLGPLADNGGNTETYALLTGSPAVDAGVCVSGIETDQRGWARPNAVSSFCDIGAYESEHTGMADVAISKTVAASTAVPGGAITYTLTYVNRGAAGAAGVVITDLVPITVTRAAVASTGATITPVDDVEYAWRVSDLSPRAGGLITVTGVVTTGLPAGHVFTNTAAITTTSLDTETSNNADDARVTIENGPPVAGDLTVSTDEDVSFQGNLPASDPNGKTDPLAYGIEGNPLSGSVVVIADAVTGEFVYTPTLDYAGNDSFVYVVSDTAGLTDTGTVTVTVVPVNDPPVAGDDVVTTEEEEAVEIAVLDNDVDPDEGDELTVVGVGEPGHGVARAAEESVVYTPTVDYNGVDVFTYTVSDGELSDTGAVSVTVTGVNDPPTISDIADQSTHVNTPVGPIPFTVSDVETSPDALSLLVLSSNTTLVPTSSIGLGGSGITRLLTISPTAGLSGMTTITVTVSDGTDVASDSFVLTVLPFRVHLPLVTRASGTTGEGQAPALPERVPEKQSRSSNEVW